MKFYEPYTHWNCQALRRGFAKSGHPTNDFRAFYALATRLTSNPSSLEYGSLAIEHNWMNDHAPYYNIWPGIIPLLTSLKLDIDGGVVKYKRGCLMLRFPEGKSLSFTHEDQKYEVRTILAGYSLVGEVDGISLFIDINERGPYLDPIYTIRNFQTMPGTTIEQTLDNLPQHPSVNAGIRMPESVLRDCVRIVCSIQLLDQGDSDLILPQVLSKDLSKYERTKDPKYVDKAHRRGKLGWDIGKGLQMKPHWRQPHLCLYWTGKGRTTPIIKQRGLKEPIIVHRKQVEQLPTDYLEGKNHAKDN